VLITSRAVMGQRFGAPGSPSLAGALTGRSQAHSALAQVTRLSSKSSVNVT